MKPKTISVTESKSIPVCSFKKGEYVISIKGSIVLCDGGRDSTSFSGTLIKNGGDVTMVGEGEYYCDWQKKFFYPFEGKLTICC